MSTKWPIFALFVVATLAPRLEAGDQYIARVVGIVDGDTIDVLSATNTQVRIRLWGIDSPEPGQDFSGRAKELTSSLAFNNQVLVKPHNKDRNGRTVAEIVLPNGKDLGQVLVGYGLAWWERRYAPNDVALARLETEARAEGRGLWSGPNPIAPWLWRSAPNKPNQAPATGIAGGGGTIANFVASRNGKVFHIGTCSAVLKIKPENRVLFGNMLEAQARGLRLAADCLHGHRR